MTSNRQTCQVFLRLTLHSRGCFHACISYQNQPINNGEFDIIVLSENERNNVERNVSTSGVSIDFEAYLYNAASCHQHAMALGSESGSHLGKGPMSRQQE